MQFEFDDEETCAFLDLLTEAIRGRVKSEPGQPMTLGGAAAAVVRLIVLCWDCGHQVTLGR